MRCRSEVDRRHKLSDDPANRPRPGSDDFDPKQHTWDGREWWTADHKLWWDGTRWQPEDAPRPQPAPGTRQKPRPPGWWRDFWLGLAGTIVGNGLLFVLVSLLLRSDSPTVQQIALALPWLVNLGLLIFFAIKRVPVALGMVTAYSVAFGLVLVAGIVFLAICFGALGSGQGGIP